MTIAQKPLYYKVLQWVEDAPIMTLNYVTPFMNDHSGFFANFMSEISYLRILMILKN